MTTPSCRIKFGEPDEFMRLQAQNAHSRRAAYGINGAKPGVQVTGSKPVKSRSEFPKTDMTTSYNKPEEHVNIHPSLNSSSMWPNSLGASAAENGLGDAIR